MRCGNDMMVKRINSSTLREQAYQTIKEAILRNELLPDTVLSIDALADELGTSQTPVREALARLSADGLIDCEPHKQPRVSSIATDEIQQAYQTRKLLEPHIFTIVASRVPNDQDLEASLRDLLRQTESTRNAASEGTLDLALLGKLVLEMDLGLQRLILEALGNTLIAKTIAFVNDHSLRIRTFVEQATDPTTPVVLTTILDEHRKILKALLDSNRECAREATLAHLNAAEKRTLETLSRRTGGTDQDD